MADDFWYVIYVKAKTEKRVVQDLARYVALHDFGHKVEPFCPETEYYYRSKSKQGAQKKYLKRPMLPGYVIVQTTMQSDEFMRAFSTYVYNSQDAVRILRRGESNEIALSDSERMRLEYILNGTHCLEHSQGYIVGDRVVVTVGPMIGHEGLITYINRHNRYADIEVELFGSKVSARVALEIVEKRAE